MKTRPSQFHPATLGFAVSVLAMLGTPLSAQLAVYEFTNNSLAVTDLAPGDGVAFSAFSINSYTTNEAFSDAGDLVADPTLDYISLNGVESPNGTSDAFANGEYLSFTITNNSGADLALTRFTGDFDKTTVYQQFQGRVYDTNSPASVSDDTISKLGAASGGTALEQDEAIMDGTSGEAGANWTGVPYTIADGVSVTFSIPLNMNSNSDTRYMGIDNIAIEGVIAGTYYWTGGASGGDGVSLFDENNWNSESDGSGNDISTINPSTGVNVDLVVSSGTPGGGGGANGELNLGLGSLTMTGGSLSFAGANGISSGSVTVSNGASSVTADHLNDSSLNTSGGATLTFVGDISNSPVTNSGSTLTANALTNGSDATLSFGSIVLNDATTPLDGSTIDLVGTPSGSVTFANLSLVDTINTQLGNLTVDGAPAVATGPGQNITYAPDGGSGTTITKGFTFTDTDSDTMDDNWELAFFGDLSRDGTLDFDNDGLLDAAEYSNTTIPNERDSDDDLLSDGDEVNIYGTNPTLSDTDGDSNPDGFEVAKGTDPLSDSSSTDRPNIIFIFADDLGWGDLGVLWQNAKSGKKHKTPFFDQLAAEGMIFNRHYCPAPVCAPSRGSLLTGLHQGHANIRNNQFDKELEDNHNLANTLRKVGYSTALIGKWGTQGSGGSPSAWPAYPTKRGFDYFFGYVRHGDGHTHYPDHVTDSRGRKELYDQNSQIRDDLDMCFTPDLFTARAKKLIIDEVNDGDQQPFFLYLAYDTPHAALQLPTVAYPGWNPSDDLDDSGFGVSGGVQWIGTPGNMINTATGTIDSYRHPDYTTAVGNAWTDVEERQASLIRRMDDNIGDLRKTLEDLGIANNTLIVFSSDNGPHSEDYLSNSQTNDGSSYSPTSFDSYGPFEGIKRDCWEGGIREPSLAVWPGTITPGSLTDLPTQLHDWLPTFCELAGVTQPSRTDGVSLVPTLTGSGTQKTPTTYIEYNNSGSTPNYGDFNEHGGTTRAQAQVIYLDGYKGIRSNPGSAATDFEIYDVSLNPAYTSPADVVDPEEANNLSNTSSYFTDLNQRMKDRVLQIRQPDSSAARAYMDTTQVPSLSSLPPLENGVIWEGHTGVWPWIPEFTTLAPTTDGTDTNVSLTNLPAGAPDSGMLFTGYIDIPTGGTWNFHLTSDSGSFLNIHDIIVVDDDYDHDGTESSGSVLLAAGRHPFRLYYVNRNGNTPSLSFEWDGPGVAKAPVPAASLFVEGTPDPEPVGVDDLETLSQGQDVLIDVLANDIDDGEPNPPGMLSITGVTSPVGGTAVIESGMIRYTPTPGFAGVDSFIYELTDGQFTASATVTVDVTLPIGPDFWIPMNESSGSQLHEAGGGFLGSLSASAVRTDGPSGYGGALSFNGSDSDFALNGAPTMPSGGSPRTIMAWVKVPSGEAGENQTIFGYGNNSNGQRFTFRLNGSGGASNPGTPNQAVRLEVQGGSIVGNAFVDDGNWHHIAVVCDDFDGGGMNVNEVKIYVDGVLDTNPADTNEAIVPASNSSGRAMNTQATTPTLGGSNHASNYTFLGELDELRLFNQALTTAEVAAYCNLTHPASTAWHARYFGDSGLTPIDWSLDDDGDGLSLLLEHGLAGNPTVASTHPNPVISLVGGAVQYSFARPTDNHHNLVYTLEDSDNLQGWLPVTGVVPTIDPGLMPETESVIYDLGASGSPRRFLRLGVEFE